MLHRTLVTIQRCLTYKEFPVSLRAYFYIQYIVHIREAAYSLAPNLRQLLNLFLLMVDDVDSTEIVARTGQL